MSHPHHHHGGCHHDHNELDHTTKEEMENAYSLYKKIDNLQTKCFNEKIDNSCLNLFRSYAERMDRTKFVESDCDSELLIHIVFNGLVKVKSIIIMAPPGDEHPDCVELFKNVNDSQLSFDAIKSKKCEQKFDLQYDENGVLEYPLKVTKFNNVYSLTLFIPSNNSGDDDTTTKVYYIGLKGDFLQGKQEGVVITNYEMRANPADHKTKEESSNQFHIQ
ncbi:hypothetical protein SNEBB_009594 [Seison nebaliae]|nr:hypothetical protein SNEBB_009594 [Seison nebaliae]